VSKFGKCLPEDLLAELVARTGFDAVGARAACGEGYGQLSASARPELSAATDDGPITVRLRPKVGRDRPELLPANVGRWQDLPPNLSVDDLNLVAHVLDGYDIDARIAARGGTGPTQWERVRWWEQTGEWPTSTADLLSLFFFAVRSWRGMHNDGPADGDAEHEKALRVFRELRARSLAGVADVRYVERED
jgi:hypothetical protein